MLVRISLAWILLFSIVNQLEAQDVWLQNNFSPVTACSLTNAESVSVLINNNSGTVMVSNTINVSYSVNGGAPVLQLLNSNLFPGASWNFTFSVKADLSACGTYALKVWVSRAGDANQLNDTLQWSVTNNCFNAPGSISGAATVCQGQDSVTYTFPAMLNATAYDWTLPNGASGSSSTNTINVDYSTTATSGNITVAGTNTCGSSTAATLPVSVNPLPDAGGNISGATTVCPGETAVTYTVPPIANALSYQWTLPGGASGSSTTNQIVVDYGTNAVSGPLTAEGINGCGSGLAASASITINTDAPVAICQNITQYLNAAGTASITASQINNGSSDACGIASLSVSPSTFTCANVGANTVTLTVTDNSSNISTCNATVTILDTIRPVATCRNVTTYLDANGNAAITAAQVNNGSADACGIASLAVDVTAFDCSDTGANAVVLTVTDVNGNSSACSAIVTVVDTIAPVAVCQSITVQLDANGNATIAAADIDNGSTDACGIAARTLDITAFDCSDIGANTVVLTVTDVNGNASACTATVTVADTVAPVAACQSITAYLDANGNATVTAAQINNGSTDACGIASLALDITTFDCSDIGANTVVLTVTDVNGNSSTCTTTINVEDTIAPVAVCQSLTVQLDATGNATINAADINNGSTDACGIATSTIDITDFDCADIGTHTVTLTVTDVNGNSSACSATVTVADTIAPVAACHSLTVQLDANGNATIAATDIDNGSTDACGIAARTLDITAFDCSNVGVNTVTLTVTDVNGNASTCTAVVTVQDTTAPVATCRNITVQLDAGGSVTITGAQVDNGSTDLCGVASLAVSPNTFDCSNVGANTVTLTVTDASGNTSACTATVTVEDTTAPTAICQNISVALSAAGTANITAAQINNGSADACGIATITVSPTDFACANTGANNVTLTVTDVNGNTSTCTAVVTVTASGTAVGSTLNQTVCSGLSYNFNGQLLTASGTYYDTLATVNGCDSIVTLNLVISLLNTSSISASICPTGFYNFYGRILTDAGVYTDTVSSLGGCDTIVTLALTKTAPNTNATVSGNVCTAAQSGAVYQWYTCNTGQPIQGATSQSYVATQPGSYQCLVTFDSCAAPTICVLVNPVDIGVLYSYKFNLYPNPNAGTFAIQHDYPGEIEIVIEDMLGQRLKQFNMASATGYFDINEFAAGIYNVIVSDKKERLAVIKVVKQ
jgi:hypothetical protein